MAETRTAIVTGGLRGLGRAMAFGLAREGHNVLAVGHIESDVAAVEAEAVRAQMPSRIVPLVADLREAAECDRVAAEAAARFGGADILVNNAGLTFTYIDPARYRRPTPQRFWEVGDDIVDNVIATNYLAADRLARRVAPGMVAQGWGRIVNVTTKLDTMNRLGTHPYGASKAALEMATEVWAKEVAGTGLTVNIVNPGAGANTPGMADEPRRPRRPPSRARRDGAALVVGRLARRRRDQRRPLRRQSVGSGPAARRSRPPRRPPRGLRAAPGGWGGVAQISAGSQLTLEKVTFT
jgi:NAD(P)-dependent dehydrogenase (short-subunit alcohol dehydrogenase family)